MIRVQREAFDIGAEFSNLTQGRTEIGGVALFVGLVRDMIGKDGDHTAVRAMTLEHYPGMTEKQLTAIEQEACSRWKLDATLIIHRYGRLEPGDPIVLVATASAHREAALDSCAFLIDWLKTKAPFWKQEETPEGDHWVAADSRDDARTKRWQSR